MTDAPDLAVTLEKVVKAIRDFEPVTVITTKESDQDVAKRCGIKVDTMAISHESPRLRDMGPTFLVDGKGGSAAIDWKFRSWGEGSLVESHDSKLTHALLGEAEVRRFRAPLTLDGGAFICDDIGTLIASSPAIFENTRNPKLSHLDAFDILTSWLGAQHVIWVDQVAGHDTWKTDIRRICAFVGPGHVLVGKSTSEQNACPFEATAEQLSMSKDARGLPLTIGRVPVAHLPEGTATYTDFYLLNKALLIPKYDVPEDDIAAENIEACFPGRQLIQIDARTLLKARCSLSSLLQYQPARLLERHKATILPKSAWHRPVPDYEGLLDSYIERLEDES